MFVQVTGKNITEMWFNFLVHVATGQHSRYYNPSMYSRRVYGFTNGVHFDKDIMEKDFFKYSGYNREYKLNRLRESYFSDKVKKQFDVLLSIVRSLQPRQARGLISFSEPAFNKTDRLKCLDSLYIQKETMTTCEALIIFRNTEVWPKTYMDFIFLHELLVKIKEERVKCTLFSAFMTSSFINFHQSASAALFMRKYGIISWNDSFKKGLIMWKKKFSDPAIIDQLKMKWIARVVKRTHELFEIDGVNIDMLIEGK